MAELIIVYLRNLDKKTEIHLELNARNADEARATVEGWMDDGEKIKKIESVYIDDVLMSRLKLLCTVVDNLNDINLDSKFDSPVERMFYEIMHREKTIDSFLITSVLPTIIVRSLNKKTRG
jgi:hypothetical protein